MSAPLDSPRSRCWRCFKPELTCVCARTPRIENRTSIVIVQHPRERFHALGTARFAALGLARATIEVAHRGRLNERPASVGKGAALLYPGPHARPLSALHERGADSLVVLDGTWHHARTLYRDLPWLRALPCYDFTPAAPSRYRLRREPFAEAVSTIEAIVHALSELEPDTPGLPGLLTAFDSMIDQQVALLETGRTEQRERERRPPSARLLPRALVERFGELVVVYAEVGPRPARALLQVVAARPAQRGSALCCLLSPERPPSPSQLEHLGLDAGALRAGESADAARERFAAFVGDAPIAAWHHGTLDALASAGWHQRGIALKAVYARAARRRPGTLERAVAAEGIQPWPVAVPGRAAHRLGHALALAAWLAARADGQGKMPDAP